MSNRLRALYLGLATATTMITPAFAVDLTVIAGLAVVPLLLWRRAPLPVALVAAVAVTALLRI